MADLLDPLWTYSKVLQPGALAFTLKLFISIDCLLCKVVSQAGS